MAAGEKRREPGKGPEAGRGGARGKGGGVWRERGWEGGTVAVRVIFEDRLFGK